MPVDTCIKPEEVCVHLGREGGREVFISGDDFIKRQNLDPRTAVKLAGTMLAFETPEGQTSWAFGKEFWDYKKNLKPVT